MDNTNKVQKRKIWRYLKDSAIIGLVITVGISAYQIYQSDGARSNLEDITDSLNIQKKQISQSLQTLDKVEKALTTHFLGSFPGYISEINNLLKSYKVTNDTSGKNTIIIFEDVLYYGIRSSPKEFFKMNKRILELADNGCHIVIAYYDPRGNRGYVFTKMVEDELISPYHSAKMREEMASDWKNNRDKINEFREKYFDLSRKQNRSDYENRVKSYRQKINIDSFPKNTALDKEIALLCMELDSIKHKYMGDENKNIMSIKFKDFLEMYRALDLQLKQHYTRNERTNFIELIEINEYLTMSCWLVGDKAILAFPSKYASEEIGFESQDQAFIKYINTMLYGVRTKVKFKDYE